ncbi:MAG: hypothetical protein IJ928_03150 [Prevotella sp.]|nr:hypothetical protein [Prevotella sp.]
MKQKFLLLVCALIVSTGLRAVTYLKVGNTSVTATGAVNSPYLSSGSIYFDANTKILTLNSVNLTITSSYNGITILSDGITVVCNGQNTIRAMGTAYNAIRLDENSLQDIKFKGNADGRAALVLMGGSEKSGLHLNRYCACTIEHLTIQASGNWGIDGTNGTSQETLKLGEGAFLNLSGLTAAMGDMAVFDTLGNDYGVVGSCPGYQDQGGMFYSSKHELGFVDNANSQYHTFTSAKVFHKYGLKVGDVAVTSENDNGIHGTGISGTVWYNSMTHTLVLNGATVNAGSPAIDGRQYYLSTLNVEAVNTSRLASSSGYYDMHFLTHVNLRGTGKLCCQNAIAVAGNIMLTFEGGCHVEANYLACNNGNADVNVKDAATKVILSANITGFHGVFFNDGQNFSRPNMGYYDPTAKYVKDANGNTAQGVTIEYVENYGLKVGGLMVNNTNAAAIEGQFITGTASYDAARHRLTLNNATISNTNESCIYQTADFDGKLTVYAEGNNVLQKGTFSSMFFNKNAELTGPGKISGNISTGSGMTLNISVAELNGKTISGPSTSTLTFSGAATNVSLSDNVSGFQAMNLTDGLVLLKPRGGHYDAGKRCVTDADGNRVAGVTIGAVKSYGITVGDTEVNNYNYDAFNDNTVKSGSVAYDPATKTLTLSNVNMEKISGPCIGLSADFNGTLTLKLIGTNNLYTTSAVALYLLADATITGPGSLQVLRDIKVGNGRSLTIKDGAAVSVRSLVGTGNESLYLRGATTLVEATNTIKDFYRVPLGDGLDFFTPLGGKYDPQMQKVVDVKGNGWDNGVSVKLLNKLGIFVAGIPVCDFNASDIKGASISGSASYDADRQTLTIDNLVSEAPAGKMFLAVTDLFDGEHLNVVFTGQNKADNGGYISIEKDVTLGGNGKVDLGGNYISLFGASLHINGPTIVNCEDIKGNWDVETLTLSGARTRVELAGTIFNLLEVTLNDGLAFIEPEGGYYDADFMCVLDAGGDMALGVVIANPDAGVPTAVNAIADAATTETYDLQGRRLNHGQAVRGITIMRRADGSVRKTVVK